MPRSTPGRNVWCPSSCFGHLDDPTAKRISSKEMRTEETVHDNSPEGGREEEREAP